MDPIKTAVIGVGRLGKSHARWLSKIDSSELVGVFDIDSERCAEVAGEIGTQAFTSLAETLREAEAVIIATPTTTHHAAALEALNAGADVLIEKPIAGSLSEAREIVEAAEKQSRTLTVGHIERFNPAYLALQEMSVRPRFIEAHRLAAFSPRSSDVAVILDLMIHDIDLALSLVKSPVESIQASAVPVLTEHADIANVRIGFENGAVANLTASRISLQSMRKMRIFQEAAYYSLDFAAKVADIYHLTDEKGMSQNDAPDVLSIPMGESGRKIVHQKKSVCAEEDMMKMELESFLAAVRGEAEVAVSGTEALLALEVALEVEKVARAGRLIA